MLAASELDRLKRMAGEAHKPDDDRLLDDDALKAIAADVGLRCDPIGRTPGSAGYEPIYDLPRIAAEAWRIKAGIVAEAFDFIAEGGEFRRAQVYEHCLRMAAKYAGLADGLAPRT